MHQAAFMAHNKSTYMYTCSKLLNVWPCRGITSETGWSFFLSSLCSFSQFFNIKNIKIWEREELQSLEKYQQGASLLNEVMADSKDQKSSTSLESRMNWCLQKKKKVSMNHQRYVLWRCATFFDPLTKCASTSLSCAFCMW